MDSGSFLLGVMAGDNSEPANAESSGGSLLIIELVICSIGTGWFFSSWVVFWCCAAVTVLIALVPLLHFIVALVLTLFFTYGAFRAGLESSISVAILAAVFTFIIVAGTHFNFPEDENKS